MHEDVVLELRGAESREERPGVDLVTLDTSLGPIRTRIQASDGDAAVLWVFGAGGGLGGPAGGVYTRVGERLAEAGVTSLEVDYRRPGDLRDCVIDVLMGLAFLDHLEKDRMVLVGHSFGGAVVINAAAASEEVVAVAALSSQTLGTDMIDELDRPVLLVHGEADEVLSARCSHELYAKAQEPKELILYPGCRHGLDECREALDRDLTEWLGRVLEL
ncbi:MAG TPA: alpha/beta fold hydrolase [Caulobacteraceae bacterium]|nr:alpha/beta fold hydrolase [Caulobacteraceae bacterium]